ncbi:porin [Martelella alba]|uniref:porin n=1 Tax=Martelella alba TaxID=2590451 RepID=UPI00148532E3|nr:porin [Martelella alba]
MLPDIAQADITLLNRNNSVPMLDGLELQVGGFLRPQYRNKMGSADDGTYMQRGYDSGSLVHTSINYYLNDNISVLWYYEVSFDIFNELGSSSHYDHHKDTTYIRKNYYGISSQTFGTLTFGQQNSVYYSVIGAKTDLWDNDEHGQASGNGVNGNFDGSFRAKQLLKYVVDAGPVTLSTSWDAPMDDYYVESDNVRYQRQTGGALGIDYHVTKDVTLSAAYSYTRAYIINRTPVGNGEDTVGYNQQLTGVAAQWKPNNWTLAGSTGLFHDFIPLRQGRIPAKYFAGQARGWEYLAAYRWPLNRRFISAVKPYVAGDGMRWDNYHAIHSYLGIATELPYGFQIDYEHTFSNTTDNQPDENWVRLWYRF